ncbi:hypothetical protein ACOME3_006766 [Neoechinorhynchus agilis]
MGSASQSALTPESLTSDRKGGSRGYFRYNGCRCRRTIACPRYGSAAAVLPSDEGSQPSARHRVRPYKIVTPASSSGDRSPSLIAIERLSSAGYIGRCLGTSSPGGAEWLYDVNRRPSTLNNLVWHLDCPSYNIQAVLRERPELESALAAFYHSTARDITAWSEIVSSGDISYQDYLAKLAPTCSEIRCQGMYRTEWKERKPVSSVRYNPPATANLPKLTALFPGSLQWSRCCALVS